MASKYDRSVSLECPTCGGIGFEQSDDGDQAECTRCGRVLTRQELIDENGENVAAAVDEIKRDVVEDVRRQFQEAFKGSKNWKVR